MKSKIRYLVYLMDNTVGVVRNLINQNFLKACWRIKNRSQFSIFLNMKSWWKRDNNSISKREDRKTYMNKMNKLWFDWMERGGLFWWTHLIIYWLYISSVLPWMLIVIFMNSFLWSWVYFFFQWWWKSSLKTRNNVSQNRVSEELLLQWCMAHVPFPWHL